MLYTNEDWSLKLISFKENGSPKDMTGETVVIHVKENVDARRTVAEWTTVGEAGLKWTGLNNEILTLDVPKAGRTIHKARRYVYDAMWLKDGTYERIGGGTLAVERGITDV